MILSQIDGPIGRITLDRPEAHNALDQQAMRALKDLLANDGFINLLRAEGLATMPRALKARVSGDDHG